MTEYEPFDENEFEGYGKAHQRKARRQREASDRQEAYDKLTNPQKLAKLTRRGYAHCKQAKKLAALIVKGKK